MSKLRQSCKTLGCGCDLFLVLALACVECPAQSFPRADYFRQFFVKPRGVGLFTGLQSLEV